MSIALVSLQPGHALKIHKNSGFDQKQICLRHFAQNYKKIYLSEKYILGL